jgi:hypothetical protein
MAAEIRYRAAAAHTAMRLLHQACSEGSNPVSGSDRAAATCSQRGMGDSTGVAQQGMLPELVSLSGKLAAIDTHPCDKTTGHGVVGTHLKLETDKGTALNIDLGWAPAVEPIVKQLLVGQEVQVVAFRTDKRQDFSHRGAEAKSLLDEVLRRGREERGGRVGRGSGDRAVEGNGAARLRRGLLGVRAA